MHRIAAGMLLLLYLTILTKGAFETIIVNRQPTTLNCSVINILETTQTVKDSILCSVLCLQLQLASSKCNCMGCKNEKDVCKICLRCLSANTTAIFDALYVPEPTVVNDAVVHVTFDSNPGGKISGVGISSADGTGVIVPGKKNGAMQLTELYENANLMDLSATCAGNLYNCPNGHTMAFWLKVTTVVSPAGGEDIANGNLFEMGMLNATTCKFELKNYGRRQKYFGSFPLQEAAWVHYTSTFDKISNLANLYINGQLHTPLTPNNATINSAVTSFMVIRMATHDFELDDLYIFAEYKDADFVKSLYFEY